MKNLEQQKDYQLEKEIEEKIQEMESEGYIFPKPMNKGDYLFTLAVIIICLVGIFAGAFWGT